MQIDKTLIEKFLTGQCSPEEADLVIEFLESPLNLEGDLSYAEWKSFVAFNSIGEELSEKLYSGILSQVQQKKKIKLWPFFTAAAILLAIFGLILTLSNLNSKPADRVTAKNIIRPGGPKALLTLSDGKQIVLNDMKVGNTLHQDGIKITKTANGQLAYAAGAAATDVAPAYNTISTPVGGTYQLVLPDGSKVWLNASSSLKYATRFTGKERKVELSGEGYFEVAHDTKRPFRVISGVQTVEVLGTRFNINAYANEQAVRTTLLVGKVKLNAYGNNQVLNPSQEAKLMGQNFLVSRVPAENAIDWVDNDFVFDNEQLESIMRKIARWYDVEVTYPQQTGKRSFSGSISRTKSLTQVLGTMERTGLVKFKIEGRRVIAMY